MHFGTNKDLLARVPHTEPCSRGSPDTCPSVDDRTLRRTSRRNSTKSTTQHGTASLAATLDLTSHTRQSTSSTSISARSPSFCSSRADLRISYTTSKHYTTSIHHRIASLIRQRKRQVKAHSSDILPECASWPVQLYCAMLDTKLRRWRCKQARHDRHAKCGCLRCFTFATWTASRQYVNVLRCANERGTVSSDEEVGCVCVRVCVWTRACSTCSRRTRVLN